MSRIRSTIGKFSLVIAFSVAAASPPTGGICVKPTYSCSGTCGAAGFKICEEGFVPGTPGVPSSPQSSVPAFCTTYDNADDTVMGVCGVEPPAEYDPVPLGCSGGQEGQCCYQKRLPEGPVKTDFYKNIIWYGDGECVR